MAIKKEDVDINNFPLSRDDFLKLLETLIDLELLKEWPVARVTGKNRVTIPLVRLEEITGMHLDLNLVMMLVDHYKEAHWDVKYFPPMSGAMNVLFFS